MGVIRRDWAAEKNPGRRCKKINPPASRAAYHLIMNADILDTTEITIDLAARVRAAAQNKTLLRIRGGGSKDFYGEALEGEILDTTALDGVVSYEPSELVVTALAGTPLAELEALLLAQGQCLPFEPPHFSPDSTVGGMVAAGLSGPARASAGAVRDFVLGVKLINGKGEHLTFGGQVMKNVAGYDVSRLMVGAMGTLGLLTEISLKVLPIAPLEATLKFEMTQAQALEKLNTWGGLPLPLNASCWVNENVIENAIDASMGTLYLRLRGAIAAVTAACKTLGGEQMDNAVAQADWHRARNQQLQWFTDRGDAQDLWRLSVPQTTPPLDLPSSPFIEWHGGLRWVRVAPEHAEQVRQQAGLHNGHGTLFVAACARKACATGRFDALKPPLDKIHRELKREFDPAGVFNRHRMSADW